MKLIDIIVITFCIIAAAAISIALARKFAPKHLRRKIVMGIVIGLSGIIMLSVGGTIFVMTYIPTRLNSQYQNAPQHYIAAKPIGKALVIYQPAWTDITKNAANALAKSLKDKGYDVTVNYPGSFLPKDVSDYAVLVFGTPIYNSKGSPLVVNYLKSLKGLSGKKVILFTTGSTTPMAKDQVYNGLENYVKNALDLQRIKFSNKANAELLANQTVEKLCKKI
ncbi:MAG TPA: flavodoxin domain-containing protein [Oscillospiraceae bacterium]|nr:flavodoxin domain-containing protein [Oscillospiraceae bacterium]